MNDYGPPSLSQNAPLPCTTPRPGVDKWFRIYMGVGFALAILCAIAGFVVPFLPIPVETQEDEMMKNIMGPLYGVGFLFGAIVWGISLFTKPKPWTWVYNLIVICLGLSSCTLVFCIPLLIFWLKPECKLYYGRRA